MARAWRNLGPTLAKNQPLPPRFYYHHEFFSSLSIVAIGYHHPHHRFVHHHLHYKKLSDHLTWWLHHLSLFFANFLPFLPSLSLALPLIRSQPSPFPPSASRCPPTLASHRRHTRWSAPFPFLLLFHAISTFLNSGTWITIRVCCSSGL